MERYGTVKQVLGTTKAGFQKLRIELNTQEEQALCSIQPSTSTCGGCTGCSPKTNERGLLVVHGNDGTAVNKTSHHYKIGDRIVISAPFKKQLIQAAVSLVLPFVLAGFFYAVGWSFGAGEGAAIAGCFLGLVCGVGIAAAVKSVFSDALLPEVQYQRHNLQTVQFKLPVWSSGTIHE